MKKVLIITYYWPPSGGAGVQRWLKMSKFFHQFGIEPIIITVDEKKASYPVIDNSLTAQIPENIRVYRTNTFEPLNIYKNLKKNKEIPQPGFANEVNPTFIQKVVRFIRGNFFIPDARVGWNKYAYKQCVDIINTENISAIITNSTPHSTHLVGLKLKNKFNLPWIADFRDPWTDILYYKMMYHTKIASYIDKRFERKVIETADYITGVSSSLLELLSDKLKIRNNEKFILVPNGFNPEDFSSESNPPKDVFTIAYTGTLSSDYKLETFVQSLKQILKTNPTISIKVNMLGKIDDGVRQIFKNENIEHILEIRDFAPQKEAIQLLKDGTCILLVIYPTLRNEGLLGTKLFEYLASQKPIICIGPVNGDASKIINECNAGKTIDYNDKLGITTYIQMLIDKWKINANLDLSDDNYLKYSRVYQAKEFSQLINKLNPDKTLS